VNVPVAPSDPRDDWALPALGALPTTERLAPELVRVLAPNPSPMTLDGTNTYVIGVRGSGEVVLVDPGPDAATHRQRVDRVIADLDAEVRAIALTHHHIDHCEAAAGWAMDLGCPVLAPTGELAIGAPVLRDGERLPLADVEVSVIATPGHTRDHVAFRLGSGAVLTGDHVLGRGTSVVVHPDGDLEAYLDSLRRVYDLGPSALHPGHGPSLVEDPGAVLRYYAEHRRYRELQLRHALRGAPADRDELVGRLYADVDRRLWPAAAASLSALLAMLQSRGELHRTVDGRYHLVV
jgi:glyoxylase-like metal-dependent hydrolase (beta-lactamase superfamily II)